MPTDRAETLKRLYQLQRHPEGGWFAEVYAAPCAPGGRPLMGSIYFLLGAGETSHFHEIDCDEVWYFHEGCGLKVTLLWENAAGGAKRELMLGGDVENGERAMVVIPKGAVFAAENLRAGGFTFVSCATTPRFIASGFRLVGKREVRERFPAVAPEVERLAF